MDEIRDGAMERTTAAVLIWVLASPQKRRRGDYTGGLYKVGTGQVVALVAIRALPVLELSCHPLGDASTHQANQEQYADAHCDH